MVRYDLHSSLQVGRRNEERKRTEGTVGDVWGPLPQPSRGEMACLAFDSILRRDWTTI